MMYITQEQRPKLTEKQIKKIIIDYKERANEAIFYTLVLFFLPYLVEQGSKLLNSTKNSCIMEPADCVPAGIEGLKIAVRKFDSNQEVNFITYAHYYIRCQIRKEISCYSLSIKLTGYQYKNFSSKLEFKEAIAKNLQEYNKNTTDTPYTVLAEKEEKRYRKRILNNALKKITQKKREMLIKKFYEKRKNKDIAKEYGLSKQRVGSNMQHSLSKLKIILINKDELRN